MLTGHGSAEAAEQGIKLGAFDYLTKPCELEELLKKIMAAYAYRKQEE
jgi:DNA-binding response OmpR family regulator